MQRLGTIPEATPHITSDRLARCIKDIEDAQACGAANAAAPIGQILDRLERDFRSTFTEQMRLDGARPVALAYPPAGDVVAPCGSRLRSFARSLSRHDGMR